MFLNEIVFEFNQKMFFFFFWCSPEWVQPVSFNIHKIGESESDRIRPAEMMLRCFCILCPTISSVFTVQCCCCSFFFSRFVVRGFKCIFMCFELASRCNNFTTRLVSTEAVMLYACAGICDRRKISSINTRILMYAPVCLSLILCAPVWCRITFICIAQAQP